MRIICLFRIIQIVVNNPNYFINFEYRNIKKKKEIFLLKW